MTNKDLCKKISVLDFFPELKIRRKPRVMAHYQDSGSGLTRYVCKKCGFDEWIETPINKPSKYSIPCPNCN